MPLYEYECEKCGHRFETIQKFSDPPLETCPKCGGHVHKLIAAPAFQFKGSGWYITDYAKKGSTSGDTSSSNEPSKSGGSEKPGETKTEAAPAKPEASTKSSS